MLKLSIYKNKLFLFIFFIFLLTPRISSSASYQLSENKHVQIHGFASQSYIYTDKNNFLGNSSDNGSLNFRELGINASFQAWKKLHTAVQILSRRAGEFDNGKIKLDFAIADYRVKQTSLYSVGIRAGRVKNPIGFYNDTRDVSFTRPGIILPQSIYFERTRDLSISSDGIQLYGHKDINLGSLEIELFAAIPRVKDENTELAVLNNDRPGVFTGEPSYLGRFLFKTHDNKFKISFSNVVLNMDYEPAQSETGFDTDASLQFHLSIISAQFNFRKWSITGEYARRKLHFKNMFVDYVPNFLSETIGESYYAQLSYHFNFHWKVFTRYDVLYQNKNDKDGNEYANNLAALGVSKPAHSRFAKDATIGVQWSINTSWMVQFELHVINGTGWLPLQDNTSIDSAAQKWRMAGAAISYRF